MSNIDKNVKDITETLADKLFCMDIDIGTTLYLEMPTINLKITSKLLDLKHGDRLEVSLPNLVDPAFVEKCNNNKGAEIVGRYVYEEIVYGFKSHLINIVTEPKKIMILQYPTGTKVRELRHRERVPILLPSKITFGTKIFYGSMVDISESGCQITILNSATRGENIARFISDASPNNICVKINLSGVKSSVTVPVVRKYIRPENTKVSVGLEFNYVDKKVRAFISQFVSNIRKK